MLKITDLAQEKIAELITSKGRDDLALRVAINGRGPGGFMYQLQFIPEETKIESDHLIELPDFNVYIDADSAPNLEGASLDFVDDIMERGFKIDNPNPLWQDPLSMSVQTVIDERINPAVAGHGGFVSLLEVRDSVAYIAFGGGCQGCGLANVTLSQGVDVMIREAIPEIKAVVDTTNHAEGTNPYYQPAKGGESPFNQ